MSKKFTLKSSDGETFDVEEVVALKSVTLKDMIEECVGNEILLSGIKGKILAKVIDYCKKHVECPKENDTAAIEELKTWDSEFMKVDQQTTFYLILAADFLNIAGLLDLGCQTVADSIKGKTPEEIREKFGIENDFTPEEEERVRWENQWAF